MTGRIAVILTLLASAEANNLRADKTEKKGRALGGGGGYGGGGGGYDRQGDFSSFGGRGGGGGGGSREGRPGDWPCPSCQANNFASRDACFKCSEPRAY
mmetsp:Transcript_50668/g.115065  ORF Transcript_50668/g.115065 Transcript_50668/m.115065 type:complete len:99 (-) Transcript_50668:439-735(-)